MAEPLIHLKAIHKSFGSTAVLTGVDLEVYPGQITVVVGKSGEGKSVLLKHIIGLMKPDQGQVLFQGSDLWEMSSTERREALEKIGYLFQQGALFDSMTVFENVALPLSEKGRLEDREITAQVRRVLEMMDLKDIDDKYPSQLSGGMQKRVALARALVTNPEVLLFDEPTTGLDPIRKIGVLRMIANYHDKLGFTGVLVSHAIPEILWVSQRVAFLSQGRIIFQGTPRQVLSSRDPVIQEFFEGVDSSCLAPQLMQLLSDGQETFAG